MVFTIKKPKELQVKIRRFFALWPVKLTDEKYVWLQFYYVKTRLESYAYNEGYFNDLAENLQHKKENIGKPRFIPTMPTYGSYRCSSWFLKQRYLSPEDEIKSPWDNFKGDPFNIQMDDSIGLTNYN